MPNYTHVNLDEVSVIVAKGEEAQQRSNDREEIFKDMDLFDIAVDKLKKVLDAEDYLKQYLSLWKFLKVSKIDLKDSELVKFSQSDDLKKMSDYVAKLDAKVQKLREDLGKLNVKDAVLIDDAEKYKKILADNSKAHNRRSAPESKKFVYQQ